MQDNLVIVESPAKAKTIEKFLGKDFKVMSSYGHIRDLKKKEISIDPDTLMPQYEIPEEKKHVVSELKANAKKAKKVWLASDEDREGEAISWHLCEVLGLDEKKTSRIVFHEITKNAILEAIEKPRQLDMNLTNAQQARRVLDRLVGFNLSPVLWRKVKPSLSAGRVQSVAVRLIVEREREIQSFKSEPYFRISAVFMLKDAEGNDNEIRAELDKRFNTHEEAVSFLEKCRDAKFTIDTISKKPLKRTPAPPFTTSTLQQEAARKLGFTVSQTMMVAQHLYENGHITYMRTDSVNLSSLCIGTSKEAITKMYGEEYSKSRNYSTHTKGAQEAHEAIRPTYMSEMSIEGTLQERRLYELIWKRTAATQMSDAQIEKTTVNISISNCEEQFVASGEVITFDGFLKVYRESDGDEDQLNAAETSVMPVSMKEGDSLDRVEISSFERTTMGPIRYTEASLVHKLEELGIGRPSTYAPTISTIQQREYVQKGDKKGEERTFTIDILTANGIEHKQKTEVLGSEKGKLLPTDIGTVVNDFLLEFFPGIMDYNFTANVEELFDSIAEGKQDWQKMIRDFYKDFSPVVTKTINARSEHKAGERILGEEPKTGKPVSVKIGRFGPVVQIGKAEDKEKPRFAQLPKDMSIESITLEEALELFRLPRNVGEYEGEMISIGTGRFGPYVLHNHKYISLPKDANPLTFSIDESIELIEQSRNQEKQRHIKTFEEDAELEVMNGRYGPYIAYQGKNYRMPRAMHERAAELSYDECMKIVNAPAKTKK
ncbi:MAG: type I DNA topoisomerase [Prevotella sp.]|nr:type I DNA topoisomerase [Prevotella sp.]